MTSTIQKMGQKLMQARAAGTRDDVLTGPEPVTRVSLGKVWTGTDGDPLVDKANYATSAFAAGCFAPDQVLHAETLKNAIDRGRLWLGPMGEGLAATAKDRYDAHSAHSN